MTAHIIHGFNVDDGGKGTTDRLIPHFKMRGYDVMEHDSKWSFGIFRDLLSVRYGNQKRAEALALSIQPDDLLVGHSNGCAIASDAAWVLTHMNSSDRIRCVYFNPALDVDAPISPVVSNQLVFHTPTDKVVRLASFLPCFKWGPQGQVGYKGSCGSKVKNVPYELMGLSDIGHSGIFASEARIAKAMAQFDHWITEINACRPGETS
jgi:hypothetical protein